MTHGPTFMAEHWKFGVGEAGICRLGGGCSRSGRGWMQQWQTGWQPQAAELWDTVICCLQLPGWLHSLYGKYLLTTYHVEDTLQGTLRDTQECDILSLSGKKFLVRLADRYQLAENTLYSTLLFAKHLQASHSAFNSLWVESLPVPLWYPVRYCYSYFLDRKLWLWKLSNLIWDHPLILSEMPSLLLM